MSEAKTKRIAPENISEAMLLRLKQLGVDYFFANPGTEFASVIRGFQELEKNLVPQPVLAAHEFLAVGMAYGHYLAQKKPQAVMTHASVGAANALIGLIGAYRMNIPLIFISGMTASGERGQEGARDKMIHWAQEAKDHAGIYREYVKWETRLHDANSLYDTLDRAYAIAMTEPRGPVAIAISRDLLMREFSQPLPHKIQVRMASSAALEQGAFHSLVDQMSLAERPILVTNRLGLEKELVPRLVELAEAQGLGILTPDDYYMSFPANHPFHLGYRLNEVLPNADLVLALDTEVPWWPMEAGPSDAAKVIHIGADPLAQSLSTRSHRGDLFLQASPENFLRALAEIKPSPTLLDRRRTWLKEKCVAINRRRGVSEKFTASEVSSVLADFLDDSTILINELGLDPSQLGCQYEGGYFRSGSASPLGWGVGCALGHLQADPQKRVILAVGDGVFLLSPMTGALLAAADGNWPLLILVLNNGGLASIGRTVEQYYPGKSLGLPLTEFSPSPVAYEKCVDFVDGWGARVSSTEELGQALRQGLEFIKTERRSVIINALIEKA